MKNFNIEIKYSNAGSIEKGNVIQMNEEQIEAFIFQKFQKNPERGGEIMMEIEEKGSAIFKKDNEKIIISSN